jgi:hypothetical protein
MSEVDPARLWDEERRRVIHQLARPQGLRLAMAAPMIELAEKRVRQAEFARTVGLVNYAVFLEGQANDLNGRIQQL